MNALNGFDSEADDLPMRFFTEKGTDGPGFRVPPLSRKDFLETRSKYYRIRGLDEKGRPTAETAKKLGLEWER